MEFNQSFEQWYAEHKHRFKDQSKEALQLAYEAGYVYRSLFGTGSSR